MNLINSVSIFLSVVPQVLVILSLVVLDYATGDATTKFLPFGPGMDSKIHKGIDATKELAVDPPIKLGDQFVSSFCHHFPQYILTVIVVASNQLPTGSIPFSRIKSKNKIFEH